MPKRPSGRADDQVVQKHCRLHKSGWYVTRRHTGVLALERGALDMVHKVSHDSTTLTPFVL